MEKELMEMVEALTAEIQRSYESGVTVEEAEKLAGKFLHAQMVIIDTLRTADLDARMKKSGLKAVAAAVYMEAATSGEKKPTEAMLSAMVDRSKMVVDTKSALDTAEVEYNTLRNYLDVFKEAHIHFRTIAKGAM